MITEISKERIIDWFDAHDASLISAEYTWFAVDYDGRAQLYMAHMYTCKPTLMYSNELKLSYWSIRNASDQHYCSVVNYSKLTLNSVCSLFEISDKDQVYLKLKGTYTLAEELCIPIVVSEPQIAIKRKWYELEKLL